MHLLSFPGLKIGRRSTLRRCLLVVVNPLDMRNKGACTASTVIHAVAIDILWEFGPGTTCTGAWADEADSDPVGRRGGVCADEAGSDPVGWRGGVCADEADSDPVGRRGGCCPWGPVNVAVAQRRSSPVARN
jgi:hypothetical protein